MEGGVTWEERLVTLGQLENRVHRMDEIKPEHYVTKKECQEMIDKAIDKHNKTATVISAILGGILLAFYCHGVLSLVGRV